MNAIKTRAFAIYYTFSCKWAGRIRSPLLHLCPTEQFGFQGQTQQIIKKKVRKNGKHIYSVYSLAVMKVFLYVLVNIYVMLLPSLSKSRGEKFLWYGTWRSLGWYWVMKDGGESFRFILLSAQRREAACVCTGGCGCACKHIVYMPMNLCVCVRIGVWDRSCLPSR